MCVEIILHRIIVGRSSNDHEVSIPVGCLAVKGSPHVKFLLGQILFYILVLDWGNAVVNLFNLLGNHIDGSHTVVLRKKSGDGKPNVAGTGHSYVILFHVLYLYILFTMQIAKFNYCFIFIIK